MTDPEGIFNYYWKSFLFGVFAVIYPGVFACLLMMSCFSSHSFVLCWFLLAQVCPVAWFLLQWPHQLSRLTPCLWPCTGCIQNVGRWLNMSYSPLCFTLHVCKHACLSSKCWQRFQEGRLTKPSSLSWQNNKHQQSVALERWFVSGDNFKQRWHGAPWECGDIIDTEALQNIFLSRSGMVLVGTEWHGLYFWDGPEGMSLHEHQ